MPCCSDVSPLSLGGPGSSSSRLTPGLQRSQNYPRPASHLPACLLRMTPSPCVLDGPNSQSPLAEDAELTLFLCLSLTHTHTPSKGDQSLIHCRGCRVRTVVVNMLSATLIAYTLAGFYMRKCSNTDMTSHTDTWPTHPSQTCM